VFGKLACTALQVMSELFRQVLPFTSHRTSIPGPCDSRSGWRRTLLQDSAHVHSRVTLAWILGVNSNLRIFFSRTAIAGGVFRSRRSLEDHAQLEYSIKPEIIPGKRRWGCDARAVARRRQRRTTRKRQTSSRRGAMIIRRHRYVLTSQNGGRAVGHTPSKTSRLP
jgi:hypothetical protein